MAATLPAGEPAIPPAPPADLATTERAAPVGVHTPRSPQSDARRIALLGNPNTGKTTLFNRLSGLRAKTSNFPGTTLEARTTRVKAGIEGGRDGDLIDLPGTYSLELDQLEARACREVLAGTAAPRGEPLGAPEVVVVVADAANLARNLKLVGEVIRRRLPTLVVLNMIDIARARGLAIDAPALAQAIGCGVVAANARAGEGIDDIRVGIREARIPAPAAPVPGNEPGLRQWAIDAAARAVHRASNICPRCGYDVGPTSPSQREGAGGRANGAQVPIQDRHALSANPAAQTGGIARAEPPASPQPSPQPPPSGRGGIVCPECGHDLDLDIAETRSDRADRVLLNPVLGLLVFAAVMTGLFYSIFTLAQFPMTAIDAIFSWTGHLVENHLPDGVLRDLLANGIVGGVGATLVFLPQICLLFFLISLLEDTGYLARGAFLMDRLLRPFGLPGHSFVPLLSSHACALPGIMATRGIPDPKERLATILVAPFMTCSARLPVYVLLTTLLFPTSPLRAALAFVGCYALGILAGVLSALVARRTILRGKSRPMALELPCYKWPSLRTAAMTTVDRGKVFLRSAGTNILMICIVLWWLGSYPKVAPPAEAVALRAISPRDQSPFVNLVFSGDVPEPTRQRLLERAEEPEVPGGTLILGFSTEELLAEADRLEARNQAQHSYLGRIGSFLQPVFAPLGYDRQLTIGVLASFAAREVFVSTMSIVVSGQEQEDQSLFQTLAGARRDDGATPIFTPATSWSLLVYYVLAMQCLPTLVVTAREAGGTKWALLQLVWMCGLAYVLAMIVFRVAS